MSPATIELHKNLIRIVRAACSVWERWLYAHIGEPKDT